MKSKFTIYGQLPGWNDFIGLHPMEGYKLKKRGSLCVKQYIMLSRIKPFIEPVRIRVKWIEPDFRRDPDNIASGGFKIILDSLVNMGIIPNDTRRWIKEVHNEFAEPNEKNPHIIVELETIKRGNSLKGD